MLPLDNSGGKHYFYTKTDKKPVIGYICPDKQNDK